jgi:competence protein ComEA
MNNPINNLFSPQEQKMLLIVAFFAILGYGLNLRGYTGAELKAAAAADSLAVILQEDEDLKIDLRTANAEELICLPGIGPKRAADILSFREQHPFTSVNQILLVKGIGIKTYQRILPYLIAFGDSLAEESGSKGSTSRPPRKLATEIVNLNSAGPEELCSLKGIGPVRAEAIIRYRNENGPFTTIEDLIKVKGIGIRTLEANRARLVTQ